MAEPGDDSERTEEPSQKRLEEALKRGDVVKSQEVNTWFVMAGATLVLMAFSAGMSRDLTAIMRGLIANSWQISVDGPALPGLFKKIGLEIVAASFRIGIQLAAPFIAFGILFNIGLGVLSRLMPQMQVFFIGLPLSILLGLLLLVMVLGAMMGTFTSFLRDVLTQLAPVG